MCIEPLVYSFLSSDMGPSKTGPSGLFATALVPLGKSGSRLVSVDAKVHVGLVFIGFGMGRFLATLYFF